MFQAGAGPFLVAGAWEAGGPGIAPEPGLQVLQERVALRSAEGVASEKSPAAREDGHMIEPLRMST